MSHDVMFFYLRIRRTPGLTRTATHLPNTTLFRSQAARVAAQIQDVAAQLAAELAPGLADLLAQAVGGAVLEAADADVGQVPFAVIRHRLRHDVGPLPGQHQGGGCFLAVDGEADLTPGAAPPLAPAVLLGAASDGAVVDADVD